MALVKRIVGCVLGAVVCGAVGVLAFSRGEMKPAGMTRSRQEVRRNPDSPAPLTVAIPEAIECGPKEPPSDRTLVMPDGARVPTLNGVLEPAKVAWSSRAGRYAEIIGVTRIDGLDWYIHANGARSTTTYGWREDLGRRDATTVVVQPTDPGPMVIGSRTSLPGK